ncbi:diguanylate cyclase [Sulfurimonas aquatica]|uniref:Diguanylate cyclase n=1 Tax=Sulfurimonas aquatica TaxID=2672570 RepID=A0A975AZI4_9BACT|nr:diguanylate cyclase [Sulfurimonas aquatica]QSZ41462.1 diguanylate cyclase [Sulfurimonas aquatica]
MAQNTNILVVDDTVVNLELLEIILSEEGYDVRTATSGEMALKSIQRQKPDLILLDVMMPGIDGYETCEMIKEDPELKQIPIIFLSAKSQAEDKVKAFTLGAVDYLVKPFETIEVIARIKTHLSIHFLEKELKQNLEIVDKYVIMSSTDIEGKIIKVSSAFCEMSGYSLEDLLGSNHAILRSGSSTDKLYKELWESIKSGQTWKGEIENIKKNGDTYWVDSIISPNIDDNGIITGYTSLNSDITDKKRIELLSITDQLTGLYNRRHFNDVLSDEINRAMRHGSKLSLMMLDVDFFKQYNDTYGHQDGDDVLATIGHTLNYKSFHRTSDTRFRLGGEEFGAVYVTSTKEDSLSIANEVCRSIQNLQIEHKSSSVDKVITVSIGLVSIDFADKKNYKYDSDSLYKIADDELYKAKSGGRNRVSFISF